MVPEGKIVSFANINTSKYAQISKTKYKTYFHILVNLKIIYIGRFYQQKCFPFSTLYDIEGKVHLKIISEVQRKFSDFRVVELV